MPISRFLTRARRVAAALVTLAGATLAAATPARAQDLGRVRYDSGAFASFSTGADAGAIYLTRLSLPGQANASSPFVAFCVDINNDVKFEPYDAYFTRIDGTQSLAHTRQYGLIADPLRAYQIAGWLTDQFATVHTTLDTLGIQGAIWSQFGTPIYTTDAAELGAVAKWSTAATLFADSPTFGTYDYSRFRIVSDADMNADPALRRYGGSQELIATVPEPATVALFGIGLAALTGVTVRRRRGTQEA